jgi:PAS domain S-box-containing protein
MENREFALFEALPDAVLFVNRDGSIAQANPCAEQLFGYETGALAGVSVEVLLPEVSREKHAKLRAEYLSSSPGIRPMGSGREFSALRSDGRKIAVEVALGPTEDGLGAIAVIRDQTAAVETREALKRTLAEVAELKDQLQAESEYLQAEIKGGNGFEEFVGRSARIEATLLRADQVAKTDSTVLILGDTGVGKELLARAIHARGTRASRPLIKVDCATLPSGLIESELFGHEKGAFTGAHLAKAGRFELADGGTVFLDEIGELPLELQTKLLGVLEDGVFLPLGSKRERRVDVRVIAATNRDLKREVSEDRFRPDLYYRLSVFPIEVPPLRERREDIPLLVSHLVSKLGKRLRKPVQSVSRSSMDALVAYDWPGNVRELQNVIERSLILCTGDVLTVEETLGDVATAPRRRSASLRQEMESVERSTIVRTLEESSWKIKGPGNAASRLGMTPSTLRSRMTRLGIQRPSP